MPLREYQCTRCGRRFERLQKLSDPPVTDCPTCGGPVEKLVSSPAFHFKGTGFYATDYAKKPETSDGSTKDAGGAPKDSGKQDGTQASADKPAAETKPETKSSKGDSSASSESASKPATSSTKPA